MDSDCTKAQNAPRDDEDAHLFSALCNTVAELATEGMDDAEERAERQRIARPTAVVAMSELTTGTMPRDTFGITVTASAKDGFHLERVPAWVNNPGHDVETLNRIADTFRELGLAARAAAIEADKWADEYAARAEQLRREPFFTVDNLLKREPE